jgi:hypothetical protein
MKLVIVISLAWMAGTMPLTATDPEVVGTKDSAVEADPVRKEAESLPPHWGDAEEGEFFAEAEGITIESGLLEPEAQELEAPNAIEFERVIIRGAAVQWFKTDNLLQLFNPFAPARYGSGEQNLAYDAITERPKGLTIFAIDFGVKRDSR